MSGGRSDEVFFWGRDMDRTVKNFNVSHFNIILERKTITFLTYSFTYKHYAKYIFKFKTNSCNIPI